MLRPQAVWPAAAADATRYGRRRCYCYYGQALPLLRLLLVLLVLLYSYSHFGD